MDVFKEYMSKNADKKGNQESNLNEIEQNGLKSLKKRIDKNEIIVMKTDKSSKFAITTPDDYI